MLASCQLLSDGKKQSVVRTLPYAMLSTQQQTTGLQITHWQRRVCHLVSRHGFSGGLHEGGIRTAREFGFKLIKNFPQVLIVMPFSVVVKEASGDIELQGVVRQKLSCQLNHMCMHGRVGSLFCAQSDKIIEIHIKKLKT